MKSFFERLSKFRVLIIAVVCALTVFFGIAAFVFPQVKINTNLDSLIPSSNRDAKIVKDRQNTDYMVVLIEKSDVEGAPELFSVQALTAIQKAIKEIDNTQHLSVAISPFEQIKISPLQKNGERSFEHRLMLKRSYASEVLYPISSDSEALQFKEDLLNSLIAQRLVINDEGTMLAFMVNYQFYPLAKDVPDLLINVLNKYEGDFKANLAGRAYFEKYVEIFLLQDLGLLFGLGILICLVLLYLGFKSFRAVLCSVSVISITTIWMLGMMSLLGIELSLVSITAPPLILALSTSYCIHIFNEYYLSCASEEKKKCAKTVFCGISNIAPTIIMASVTTIIAMFGLLITKIVQMRLFAVSVSIGIFCGAILSLTFLPAILSFLLLPKPRSYLRHNESEVKTKAKKIALSDYLYKLGKKVVDCRFILLAIFLVMLFSPILSKKFVAYNADYAAYFPHDNDAFIQSAVVSKNLSGIVHLNIDYKIDANKLDSYAIANNWDDKERTTHSNFYNNYELLCAIEKFEKELRDNEFVRYIISLPLLLCDINETVGGDDAIPTDFATRQKVDSLFKMLRYTKNAQLDMISPKADRITTTFRLADLSSPHGYMVDVDFEKFTKEINKKLETLFPPYIEACLDGTRMDYLDLRRIMDEDLTSSTIVSVVLITLVISLIFRNLLFGFFSLIPLACGLTLNFVFMALFKIPMDMTTILVLCVVVGIGVDDSVHYLLRFQSIYEAKKGNPNRLMEATRETMSLTGRPIVLTSISIAVCMGAMLFATFAPIAFFGALIAMSLVSTTIGTLIFLPMGIALFYNGKDKIEALIKKR